ncbi:MAG: DeoR/GlpR family DNA-binding transcription regulator [Granulosicoccus sp.]|nr:DeoR/GlpR family DNA-binding transcription regulator [Granulosicoccus sp.]
MGNLTERQRHILKYARERGEVQVELLAEQLEVTPQTIRRDLNFMCDIRLLQRVHGGAVVHDGVSNLGYEARRRFMAEEKTAIGQVAAELIPDDSSLFINIGTTTEEAARQLTQHRGLLVVTNNINVVHILRQNPSARFMIAGGSVRSEDGGIVGESTAEFIDQFKLDHAIIGVSAIESDGTLLDYDQQEVRVAKAIIKNARVTILVADSVKFERSAPMRIGNISEVDLLVTDKEPPASFRQYCLKNRVDILVANRAQESREAHGA